MANKPVWREWGESLLIVIVIAFVVRSFVVAPFKIPSSSMVPTLDVGDYIFVLRYPYGLRIPFTDVQLMPSEPKRGDVIVFDYPEDRSKDFIKRVIGLPGDVIDYRDNDLYINGKKMPLEAAGSRAYFMGDGSVDVSGLFHENLFGVTHDVLRKDFSIKDGEWKVPAGEYFMLGDNRNNSRDSRFWGFVPQSYLVGRAAIIWWSWDKEKDSVRWGRLGEIIR
ncbi:MAG TPA: signal peptidase I [Mariprofundaceae bacterium]|nr:signal peptidase I [Mariprofundaceae bacterium]